MKHSNDDLFDTSVLPPLDIEKEIPSPTIEEIQKNDTAYLMLLKMVQSRDLYYQKAKKEVEYYRQKSEDRRIAVVLSMVGEFLLALGTGSLFADFKLLVIAIILIFGGIILSIFSLYFGFRTKRK